jgi:hypothetical protein
MSIEIIIALIMLVLGILIGRFLLTNKSKQFDLCLIILIIFFTWIGKDSYLIKNFDFQIRISYTIQLILIGILFNRLMSYYFISRKSED